MLDSSVLEWLLNNGFAVFVATYLMLYSDPRWRKTIDGNTKAINEVTTVISRCRKN